MRLTGLVVGLVLVSLAASCVRIPDIMVYNNLGRTMMLHVSRSQEVRLVPIAPGWSKGYQFWYLIDDDRLVRFSIDGCEYVYDLPKTEGRWMEKFGDPLLIQLEPDLSLHMRGKGRQAMTPVQLEPLQRSGFPLRPAPRRCP